MTCKLGSKSIERVNECNIILQIFTRAVVHEINTTETKFFYDITVLCGHRGMLEQNTAYLNKKSKLRYPKSNHNTIPANAIDIVPYPVDWAAWEKNPAPLIELGEIGKRVRDRLGLNKIVTWGGDWSGGWDKPHWEKIE